jgi:hypothetical protein
MTKEQKISNAMKAAPASIADQAKVLDWPATEGAQPTVLREGTNGWSCFPDFPATKGNDPMCLDASWLTFLDAYAAKKPPKVTQIGFGYMIAPGGAWGSNTDPFATGQTPDNEWGQDVPHIMIVVPNTDMLAGLPTDRNNGGPWVMWRGTPWAHIMVPVNPGEPMMKKP